MKDPVYLLRRQLSNLKDIKTRSYFREMFCFGADFSEFGEL